MDTLANSAGLTVAERARFVRAQLPSQGLFAGHDWRTSPTPFPLPRELAKELDSLGRVLLQFYRAVNLLYRKSVEGKQPEWVARWLDMGKPADLVALQRHPVLKNELPRVIRPDLLFNEQGLFVTELDSVPGGIGLTAWLNRTYSQLGENPIGGPDGMLNGFSGIFGKTPRVQIMVSEEAATYRPEMQWMVNHLGAERFHVRDEHFEKFMDGDAVYRFFELFDLPSIPTSKRLFELQLAGRLVVTPPPKPILEEKMLFALLWNRNLRPFWRQELGEGFLNRLLKLTPYSWLVDPAPLPPHAAIPELNLTDWNQLGLLSHRERELILKVSGFSPRAWGARGVYLGSDLPQSEWMVVVQQALRDFSKTPYVLQRYHKPGLREARWFDFEKDVLVAMPGRVRLCPYYFVIGKGDAARTQLGGVLATICPADKKIIHGMSEAVFAPCSVAN